MKFESLLENLYFGKYDDSFFEYDETFDEDPSIRDLVSKYIDATADYPPAKLEELGRVPDELIERLKAIGFFGLLIPKEYGGMGLPLRGYLAAVREMTRYDMAIGILSLAHLSIGIKPVMLFGNERQKAGYLPAAASGDMIFCYALTEPLYGSDAKNIDTTAELTPDGKRYILNGTKTFITNASYSGGLTVFAQTDKSRKGTLGAFIVETGWDGVSRGKDMDKMGLKASSTGTFVFRNVEVPAENLLCKPGDGFKIAMTVLNYGRLALGAASSGMMKASRIDMLDRASRRVQFERPIAEFELIREKIAKAFVNGEMTWAMTNLVSSILEKDPTGFVASESSHCKLMGTNLAWESLYDAMQTAGGAGYLTGMPYEKRMRDFRVTTIFEGTTEIHSFYPPLSMIRDLSKNAPAMFKGGIGAFLRLAGTFLKPVGLKVRDGDPLIRKSLRAVREYAGLFRRNFILAVLKYGKKLPEREFVLRRLTFVSCLAFALLSMVARIRHLRDKGRGCEDQRKALEYFLEYSGGKISNLRKPRIRLDDLCDKVMEHLTKNRSAEGSK